MESLAGNLLIGSAGIVTPTFRQTVVLMAEHNDEGALGFVLNRPSPAMLDGLPEPLERLASLDRAVWIGGPVQPDAVAVIGEIEHAEEADRVIFDHIALLSLDEATDPGRVRRARLFVGYSGWGQGQLENEMGEGSWIVEPARTEDVFTTDADALWRSVLERKGPAFQLLQTMPFDPSSN